MRAFGIRFASQINRRLNLTGEIRWHRGAEDERTRPVDEIVFQRVPSAGERARTGQRLSARVHARKNLTFAVVLGGDTSTLRPHDAGCVRLVEHKRSSIFSGQAYQAVHRRNIALHAEHGLRDDYLRARVARMLAQHALEETQIAMWIDDLRGA